MPITPLLASVDAALRPNCGSPSRTKIAMSSCENDRRLVKDLSPPERRHLELRALVEALAAHSEKIRSRAC